METTIVIILIGAINILFFLTKLSRQRINNENSFYSYEELGNKIEKENQENKEENNPCTSDIINILTIIAKLNLLHNKELTGKLVKIESAYSNLLQNRETTIERLSNVLDRNDEQLEPELIQKLKNSLAEFEETYKEKIKRYGE